MTYFRKIKPEDDVTLIAKGIYVNDWKFFNLLFKNMDNSVNVITQLINSEYRNPFHRDFITIIYDNESESMEGFIISYMYGDYTVESVLNAYLQVTDIMISTIILDAVLSYIFSSKIGKNDYRIDYIYVFRKYRHQGHGSKLVEKAKQMARVCLARNLYLDVPHYMPGILSFYSGLGFSEDSKNFYGILGKTFGCYGLKCELC